MKRQLLIIAIIILAALIFLWLLLGYLEEPVSAQQIPPSKWDVHILELDKIALDRAYQTQIEHVFGVWMRDESNQPERATRGVRQARRAYIEAMTRIEAREAK